MSAGICKWGIQTDEQCDVKFSCPEYWTGKKKHQPEHKEAKAIKVKYSFTTKISMKTPFPSPSHLSFKDTPLKNNDEALYPLDCGIYFLSLKLSSRCIKEKWGEERVSEFKSGFLLRAKEVWGKGLLLHILTAVRYLGG